MRQHLLAERAAADVVALLHRDVAFGVTGHRGHELAAFFGPAQPATVHQSKILDAEELEHPKGVRRPPVVLVTVENDCGAVVHTFRPQQPLEPRAIDVVAGQWIVEIDDPIDFHRSGNVARLIEQDVLVRLDNTDIGIVQVVGHPLGRDEDFGMGVPARLDVGDGCQGLSH